MMDPRNGEQRPLDRAPIETLIDLLAMRGIVDEAIRAHVEARGAVTQLAEHRRVAAQVRVLAATILEAIAGLEAAARIEPSSTRSGRRAHSERFGERDGQAIEAAVAQLEKDLGTQNVRHLCEVFLEDVDERLERVASAIRDEDFATLRTQAHAIKGSVANFNAREAVEAACTLEAATDGARLAEQYARLERELRWLRNRIRAHCVLRAS